MEIPLLLVLIGISAYNFRVAQKLRRDKAFLLPSERMSLSINERRMNTELFEWYKERMLSPEKRKRVAASIEAVGGLFALAALILLLSILVT